MTGFGQGSVERAGLRVTATVSCVNHRHLDVAMRLPEELKPLDATLRERIAARLRRGRCEVSFAWRRVTEPPVGVTVRQEAIAALVAACRPLIDAGLLRSELTLGDLLQTGALVTVERQAPALEEGDQQVVEEALDLALAQVEEARSFEGSRLAIVLRGLLDGLAAISSALRGEIPRIRTELEAALRSRLRDWSRGEGLPEERLLQEVAVLIERVDVQEELDRFDAHREQVTAVLDEQAPAGRRLDFLAQELARELNTLAAKCRHPEIVRLGVEGKLLCEQFREQVQNVE